MAAVAPYTSDAAAAERKRQAHLQRIDAAITGRNRRRTVPGLSRLKPMVINYTPPSEEERTAAEERLTAVLTQLADNQKGITDSFTAKGDNKNMNSMQITRVQLGRTLAGKPVANLYENALQQFPALQLPEMALLQFVGIDPNSLEEAKPIYTAFTAHYEESDKCNKNGRPYKNVTRLEPGQSPAASSQTDSGQSIGLLADILMELKAIKALLLAQAGGEETAVEGNCTETPPAVNQLPEMQAATSHPATRPDRQAITATPPPAVSESAQNRPGDSQEVELFEYTYSNGQPVAAEDAATFNDYRRAHHEKAPASRESMMNWYKFKR
jgi:hypothetical protein